MKKHAAKVTVSLRVRGVAVASVKSKVTVPLSHGDRSKVAAMLEHAAEILLKGTFVSPPLHEARR